MSEKKLWGLFSGTHVVVLILGLAAIPSTLYATTSFSNVALVNPSTGVAAAVDASGRLTAVDPYSLWKDYAGYEVDIVVSNSGSQCETSDQWAAPSGKALVVTAISGYAYAVSSAVGYSGYKVYSGANCSGRLLTASLSSGLSSNAYTPVAVTFGVGIPVPAGSTLSVLSLNDGGRTFIHGYLVPSTWIAATQIVNEATAPSLAAPTSALHP